MENKKYSFKQIACQLKSRIQVENYSNLNTLHHVLSITMIWPIYISYCVCIAFIRIYKWIELQVLKPFKPILMRKGKQLAESIGVILHCPGDGEWTNADKERVLSKCPNYNTLVHLKIHDSQVFVRLANTGTLGLAETFMEKMWDFCESEEDITEFGKRIVESKLVNLYYNWWNKFLNWLELYAFNLQTKERVDHVDIHYNLVELFEIMLDPWMQYTSGYWKDAEDLNSSQIAKMELLAQKLDLKPGMRVLDLGCVFGTLCKYFVENHKVECVGAFTVKDCITYGKKLCKGLPALDLRQQDYRDVQEKFDRIVSLEVIELAGYKNLDEYFNVVDRCLADDGIFVLQVIGTQLTPFPERSEHFSHRYIFPNSNCPSFVDIAKAAQQKFVILDWQNLGQDHAITLGAWRENLIKGWEKIQGEKYDEKCYRMFIFYLSVARGLYLARAIHTWQIVFCRSGVSKDYRAAR